MVLNVYSWEYIHRYFPPEVVEQYRKQIINEWKSKQFKDKEIWERYGMSENAFYDLLKRYSKENEKGLKDKPSKPKNPYHKLGEDEVKIIIEKAREERERIKTCQFEFEYDMKKDGRSLYSQKLERLKEFMNRAVMGVRRIGHWFNSYMQETGKMISIGKSRVHEVLISAGIYEEKKEFKKEPMHLKRPEEPLKSFMMDFTQKRIGNGETEYVFGLLDMHNDAFITLTDYQEKSGDNVKEELQSIKEMLPPDQKIEIRSDGGTEFNNKTVRDFCGENDIELNIIPKGYPWLQAFIERGFRTIKEEFLNLVWIGNKDKFRDVLKDAKYGYNNRPNSAFDYRSPIEIMNAKRAKLPQQVCGH